MVFFGRIHHAVLFVATFSVDVGLLLWVIMQYYCAVGVIYLMRKKKLFAVMIMLAAVCLGAAAQDEKVQNKPYIDLRPFHFGVLVGTHLQDIELLNVGPQTIVSDDGTTEALITCDQDRWDAGFTVGVLGEARLNSSFALRIAPAMYFGTKHITFNNLTDLQSDGTPTQQVQELKTVYISTACELIYGSKRHNNHRPYIMAGINPMFNLSGKDTDCLKMKKYDCYLELGLGCDFYMPFFKLRPELKFMYSLMNSLDTNHAAELKDETLRMYAGSVSEAHAKMICLTFYFE